MTTQQLLNTLSKNRLSLDRKSFLKHYEAPIWTSIISISSFGYFIYRVVTEHFKLVTPMFFLFIFPLMALAIWLNQYLILRCKQIDTNSNAETAYKIAKLTFETLQWPIHKHAYNKYFQATNPFRDLRTWGDEMITVVVTDNKILINSICNLDYGSMAQAALSFGKNKQNVKKFVDTFNLLGQYPEKVLQAT